MGPRMYVCVRYTSCVNLTRRSRPLLQQLEQSPTGGVSLRASPGYTNPQRAEKGGNLVPKRVTFQT